MLEDQKKLDAVIFKNAGMSGYPYSNMQLALLVEMGELANEWKQFKMWKKHREIDKEKLLMEFSDCLHFALSLENHIGQDFNMESFEVAINCFNQENAPIDIIKSFRTTFKNVSKSKEILLNIMTLGVCLGISLEDMEQAYYKKHKENYKRQEEGY